MTVTNPNLMFKKWKNKKIKQKENENENKIKEN